MLLVIHILVALGGLACSTAAVIVPSKNKIKATYGLIAATLLTGTILVIQTHTSVLHSCITGLTYVSIVLAGAIAAQRRLANQPAEK